MKLLDTACKISTVGMMLALPMSIIQLGVAFYFDGTGFCISIVEAECIFGCIVVWWGVYGYLRRYVRHDGISKED